ncbi:hypothetical protein T492DRAFT_1058359, partial [Pavlovales sp. CCMP2436]
NPSQGAQPLDSVHSALQNFDKDDAASKADKLKGMLDGMAVKLPGFLDKLVVLDMSGRPSSEDRRPHQKSFPFAQAHLTEVMGDRATLPKLDLEGPDSTASNGRAMQSWLRDLSDVLPELFTAMEGDVHDIQGVGRDAMGNVSGASLVGGRQ